MKEGSFYCNRKLQSKPLKDALSYTLKVQSVIATADPQEDLSWIDNDAEIFKRAGLEPLVTIGDGRKLRLLAAYNPGDVMMISSSDHIKHFLIQLGCPIDEIPAEGHPVARMLLLKEYFLEIKRELNKNLTPFSFMKALYSNELAIKPLRENENSIYPVIKKFIEQASTGNLKTKGTYPKKYLGNIVKVSFGQGVKSKIPWMSFLNKGNITSKGIYPVYLLFSEQNTLILSFGISEDNKPDRTWADEIAQNYESIHSFFEQHFPEVKADRYGNSLVFNSYPLDKELDQGKVDSDLDELLSLYEKNMQPIINDNEDSPMKNSSPLNTILYGPPGTGKTYNTVREAVKICNPSFDGCYEEAKVKYEELKNKGRIEFVTFHQSYGYEEFIEGIRAETNAGKISYSVVDGVFKKICGVASSQVTTSLDKRVDVGNRRIWKMSLGNTLENEDFVYQECIENNQLLLGYGAGADFSEVGSRKEVKFTYEQWAGKEVNNTNYTVTSVHTFINKMSKGDLVIVSDGNQKFRAIAEIDGDYQFLDEPVCNGFHQMRKVKWLNIYSPSLPSEQLFDKALSQQTIYELKNTTINGSKLDALLSVRKDSVNKNEPHVIIIDEINRGNMSKIFGELITLIEDDKRIDVLDKSKGMTARLPNSPNSPTFGVPSNLHIIGTMNTADRSIAMMDTALRRRFEFKEMMPNPCLLHVENVQDNVDCSVEEWESVDAWIFNVDKGKLAWNKDHSDEDILIGNGNVKVNLRRMLHIMNQRIEVLYDREHTIGHAYFMPLKNKPTIEHLASIFENKVIPLLAEYFFEDWEKIRMVLGDDQEGKVNPFIIEETVSGNGLFLGKQPDFEDDHKSYKRNGDAALLCPESYIGIYKKLNVNGGSTSEAKVDD